MHSSTTHILRAFDLFVVSVPVSLARGPKDQDKEKRSVVVPTKREDTSNRNMRRVRKLSADLKLENGIAIAQRKFRTNLAQDEGEGEGAGHTDPAAPGGRSSHRLHRPNR